MEAEIRTYGHQCIWRHGEFFDDAFRRNTRFAKMTKHLSGCRALWLVRSSNLDSMIHGMVTSHCPYICCNLAVLDL